MTRFELLKLKAKNFVTKFLADSTCAHTWRPARSLTGKPVRVCMKCNVWHELSEAEFYAFFGRISK